MLAISKNTQTSRTSFLTFKGALCIFIINGQQVEDGKGNVVADTNQGVGVLYHNESKTDNNWLKVRLEGKKSNRNAYGPRVKVVAGELVHIFSLGDDDFADEFQDMKDKVNVRSIPAAILRVYRRIFK